MIPRIRRVLAPGLSYGREIRWGGLEPPPRGPQPRALPGELRTCDNGERGTGNRERGTGLAPFAPSRLRALSHGPSGNRTRNALDFTQPLYR